MTDDGLITRPDKARGFFVKQEYIAICTEEKIRTLSRGKRKGEKITTIESNLAAASILGIFERWTHWKLRQLKRQPQPDDLWVFITQLQLAEYELCGAFGTRQVTTGLNLLLDKGFLSRRNNPDKGFDRTYQYRLEVDVIQEAIDRLPPFMNVHEWKNESSSMQSSILMNASMSAHEAIPHNTTQEPQHTESHYEDTNVSSNAASAADSNPPTSVVNVRMKNGKRPEYDVYIGRASKRAGLSQSQWHNPFREGKDGTREEVIAKYAEYLEYRPDLLMRVPELVGKRLGCWCHPEPCHGDVLADLTNRYVAGEYNPPTPDDFDMVSGPALYSVDDIKAAQFTREQYKLMLENERRGRNRKSLTKYIIDKLNAHPLQPRFEEMLDAVDACTVEDKDDPGMTNKFSRVIHKHLWESRERYYTPEDLLEFASSNPKVPNAWFLAGELSKWRNGAKTATTPTVSTNQGANISNDEARRQLRELGYDDRTVSYYVDKDDTATLAAELGIPYDPD